MKRAIAILFVLLALLTNFGCSQQPDVSELAPTIPASELISTGGKIAFSSDRDGNDEIYVMNPDGTNATRLTNNRAIDELPRWSPDGKRIVFQSKRDGNYEVYIMNSDGSDQENITNNPADDGTPCWSPDGHTIAFYSNRDGKNQIYSMNVDGTELKKLTNENTGAFAPDWSPNGRQIAFTSSIKSELTPSVIAVMNVDGSSRKILNPASYSAFLNGVYPKWSPDGKIILFHWVGIDEVTLCAIEAEDPKDGTFWEPYSLFYGTIKQLFEKSHNGFASWSRDGEKIVFQSDRDGNREIYVLNYALNYDGRGVARLTRNPANDRTPDWSR